MPKYLHLHWEHENKKHQFNVLSPIDLSVSLHFNGGNVNCYYAEEPRLEVIRFGESFIGSVKEGGSCNYTKISITPHGNGTHTEGFGHISREMDSLPENISQIWALTKMFTVKNLFPSKAGNYVSLEEAQTWAFEDGQEGLVIRTNTLESTNLTTSFNGTNPPYIHPDAMDYFVSKGIKHLLIDTPSVDPESDGGLLAAHKAFWRFPLETRRDCTITELICIPPSVKDGLFLLHISIPPIHSDALPTRPILFPIME